MAKYKTGPRHLLGNRWRVLLYTPEGRATYIVASSERDARKMGKFYALRGHETEVVRVHARYVPVYEE